MIPKKEGCRGSLREMRLPVMANQIVTMYEASELNDVIKVLDIITLLDLFVTQNRVVLHMKLYL